MVIKSIISTFLAQLDETSLETSFRNLLRSRCHTTIFERTRHGEGEHGKDIVSLSDSNGTKTVNVFQLKVREITTNRFRTEVKPELDAMIQVPITHSMIKGNEPISYFLISTGDFTQDASIEFEAYNKHNIKKGDPEIILWNRSHLTQLFYEDISTLSILNRSFQEDVARVWLNLKSKKSIEADWLAILTKTLNLDKKDAKPFLVLGIATSFLATEAFLKREIFIAFDIYRTTLVNLWYSPFENETDKIAIFDQLHSEFCILIERLVQEIENLSSKENGLFQEGNGAVESILYPIRTFSALGALSYLAYFYGKEGNTEREQEIVDLIEKTIRNNKSVLTPPADFLRKDIAIAIMELCRNKREMLVEQWIENLLDNLNMRYIKSGWSPSKAKKPKEIIEDNFQFTKQKLDTPESFLIPLLFQFCAKLGLKKVYEKYSKAFFDFRLLEFTPPSNIKTAESELVTGHLGSGTVIERKFPHNFQEYCKKVKTIKFKPYTPIQKGRPYILQMISDINKQHVFPEIYFDF